MGSIPVTDKDFLVWREEHRPGLGSRDAMIDYMRHLNGQNKSLHDKQMERWHEGMRAGLSPEKRKELEDLEVEVKELRASTSAKKTLIEELSQTIALTPQNNTQNILPLQTDPNPQIIAPIPEHSFPQNNTTLLPLEQTPPQNILTLNDEHGTSSAGIGRTVPTASVDTNKLTMQQALDLFEMLQARMPNLLPSHNQGLNNCRS